MTKEEVRIKIQTAFGQYDELQTLVKKRKLRLFGHVSRSPGLLKTMKGERKKGTQKRRLENNIKEWTRLDFLS